MFTDGLTMDAERVGAGENRSTALRIDDGELAVLQMAGAGFEGFHRLTRTHAGGEMCECGRAEPGVGNVLRGDSADAGGGIGTARGDSRRGGGHGGGELAGARAMRDDGKCHSPIEPRIGGFAN